MADPIVDRARGSIRSALAGSIASFIVLALAHPSSAGAAPEPAMSGFVAARMQLVSGYLTGLGLQSQALPSLTFIPSGTSVVSHCVDQDGVATQSDLAFNYCPTDNVVYVGQRNVGNSYRRYGATGPGSGLAHEYGHFLQAFTGVPDPHTPKETIRHENQADCVSGAFTGYLDQRGDVDYAADARQLSRYLTATASVQGPGRNHGTAVERMRSFALGYRGALPACNQFYPATPLTT